MLQPEEKSFPHYIIKWYEFWSNTKLEDFEKSKIIKDLWIIDNSILILDDIFDESQKRNWRMCLYRKIGIQWAIIKAELLKSEFVWKIIKLMQKMRTNEKNQVKVIEHIHNFLAWIYKWEDIDILLGKEKTITKKSISKYFKMISLFTWWHIQFGLEIWQLIANKEPNKNLSKIAISLWITRQIYDDFCDYFLWHHEPFWDFLTHSNRLPEILFKLEWWDINKIETMLKKDKLKDARNIILDNNIRKLLYKYCKKEIKKIWTIKTKFDFSKMIADYEKILTK